VRGWNFAYAHRIAADAGGKPTPSRTRKAKPLSEAQRQRVDEMVGQGMSDKDIAFSLGVMQTQVYNYRRKTMKEKQRGQ
jgi:FixJ family two-component response regulator